MRILGIAFLITNYIYPVIYYQSNPYFSLFLLDFPENYICKGVSLATVGFSFFTIGICENNRKSIEMPTQQGKIERKKLVVPKKIMTILLTLFNIYLVKLYLTGSYTTEFEHSMINAVLVYIVYYFIFAVFYNNKGSSLLKIFSKYRTNWILVLVYTILFLLIGSRTIPLRIVFVILIMCHFCVKKISGKLLIISVVAGIVFMSAIGLLRQSETIDLSLLSILSDLMINARSLYVLSEYADSNGLTFGTTMLGNILSVIPFAQSIFIHLTGLSQFDISSAGLVTLQFFSPRDPDLFGLGTNVIGDLYVSFGLFGVVVFMFLGGMVIRKIYGKISFKGEGLYFLVYALIFMDAIYITRSSYFTCLRSIFWCLAIYLIFNKFFPLKQKL